MAEKNDSFEEASKAIIKKEKKYPWSEWTSGGAWTAEQGIDFHCNVDSFISILRAKARDIGMKVRAERGLNEHAIAVVVFEFTAPMPEDAA